MQFARNCSLPDYDGDINDRAKILLGGEIYNRCPVGEITRHHWDFLKKAVLAERFNIPIIPRAKNIEALTIIIKAEKEMQQWIEDTKDV